MIHKYGGDNCNQKEADAAIEFAKAILETATVHCMHNKGGSNPATRRGVIPAAPVATPGQKDKK